MHNKEPHLLNFVYTLGREKVTSQEAAMIFYMCQVENRQNKNINFNIEDFISYFNNTASRKSWSFAMDMMTLSDIVTKSKDGAITLTEYGETWVNDNLSSIHALSMIYEGDAFNENGKC